MRWLVAPALLFSTAAAFPPGVVYGNLNPISERLRPPTPLIVAEETGGSLLGGAIGGLAATMAAGYVASAFRSGDPGSTSWRSMLCSGYPGALFGLPLGAATGTYAVGALEKQGGAWWASILGAYVGAAAGVGLAYTASRSEETGRQYVSIPLYVLAGIVPLSGAVIGYNISKPCLSSRCYEQRFGLLRPGAGPDARAGGPPQPGVWMHLVSVQI